MAARAYRAAGRRKGTRFADPIGLTLALQSQPRRQSGVCADLGCAIANDGTNRFLQGSGKRGKKGTTRVTKTKFSQARRGKFVGGKTTGEDLMSMFGADASSGTARSKSTTPQKPKMILSLESSLQELPSDLVSMFPLEDCLFHSTPLQLRPNAVTRFLNYFLRLITVMDTRLLFSTLFFDNLCCFVSTVLTWVDENKDPVETTTSASEQMKNFLAAVDRDCRTSVCSIAQVFVLYSALVAYTTDQAQSVSFPEDITDLWRPILEAACQNSFVWTEFVVHDLVMLEEQYGFGPKVIAMFKTLFGTTRQHRQLSLLVQRSQK